ncbi:aldo/keto reductase [Nitzschia inconspicua]|uniref:Aldo/keto reductase n=1 Tax=Nitzschia inconspicua TaxID=303405 RepID=A0A9K3PCR1_9STRA|nr:aldo/keto reductase [Nitzschia inconspicua]
MKVAIPRAYLGTMTFGWSQTSTYVGEAEAEKMIKRVMEFDNEIYPSSQHHFIDTARIYAGGKTEQILGQVLKKMESESSSLKIGTKAAPSVKPGGLSPDGIRDQFQASMDAMGLSGCYEYYLHQPDTEHSLLESLKSADSLLKDGKISVIGMSNYHASEMARAFELCREHDLTPPSVYQGLYNPLNRLVEEELLPILKQNGCSFVAYNPLAAGLLTGKHKDIENVSKGRFKENQNYLPRFYTPANFEALRIIQSECEKHGITMVEATFRWLLCHSSLDSSSDGFLLGASSLKQLDENLDACRAAANSSTPLPPTVLEAFDKGWALTKDGAFKYWRSYSSDMPDRDNLDQGASYNAAKTKK